MQKCVQCSEVLYSKELERNFMVCGKCGYHYPITARRRIEILMDHGKIEEFDTDLLAVDSLSFHDMKPYPKRLIENREKSKEMDAVVTGNGTLMDHKIVIAVMDFGFMGGSMGAVVGEKITRTIERGAILHRPVIIISASGGARMQEGIYSLMQMAKTSGALAKLAVQKMPYISVLTNNTYAGVLASFASLGDIIIAEPGAHIGFTGQRVIEQTIREKLPEGFQSAEFVLKSGFIDRIVPRKALRETLGLILDLLLLK